MSNQNIAVIAIHGVGDHQPFEMARSVADLLGDLTDSSPNGAREEPRYSSFSEQVIRVHVSPVETHSKEPEQENAWGPFDARMKSYNSGKPAPDSGPAVGIDHEFMEGQLAHYKSEGPEDSYEFLRLDGRRCRNAAVGRLNGEPAEEVPEKDLHIYDMFWSDLSGVGKGLPILSELYQILFHLGSVGVNNVIAARMSLMPLGGRVSFWWKWFDRMHTAVVGVLAWPIALLSLILFALSFPVIAVGLLRRFEPYQEVLAVSALITLGITGGLGFAMWKGSLKSRWIPIVGCLLSLTLFCLMPEKRFDFADGWREGAEWVSVVALVCVLAGVLWPIVSAYDRRRPGTKKAFRFTLYGVVAAYFLMYVVNLVSPTVPWSADRFTAATQVLRVMESALMCLALSWVAFGATLWASCVFGFGAALVTAKADPTEKERATRTGWTARLTLALPSAFFLLLTLAGWSGFVKLALPLLPHGEKAHQCDVQYFCYAPLIGNVHSPTPVSEWTTSVLFDAGVYYLAALLLVLFFAGALAAWAFLPSVVAEVSPPLGDAKSLERDSSRMFNWLTSGFSLLRLGGEPIYWGMALFPPCLGLVFLGAHYDLLPFDFAALRGVAVTLVRVLGAIVAGAGVGLLGLSGRLSKLALGFRPIVRVALDVDNWLREHPRDANPTARISARYTSLLRHVCQWQGEDGRGYEALVIFAHSQGTVITADLLRFLRTEQKRSDGYDPRLSRLFDQLPVYLLTMGCPLRQLYALRFPYLYGYASTQEGKANPNPEELGVRQWVNAYRSGDYVGRHIWREQPWVAVGERISLSVWKPPVGLPKSVWHDEQFARFDFSIGPGAHTHYWDDTALAIAETLDILIARPFVSGLPKAQKA